jgi:hypothetical protein
MEPAHRIVLGPTQEQLSGYHPEDVDLKCGFPEEVAAAARKAARAKMAFTPRPERRACESSARCRVRVNFMRSQSGSDESKAIILTRITVHVAILLSNVDSGSGCETRRQVITVGDANWSRSYKLGWR